MTRERTGASVQIALKEFGKIRKVFQTANIKKTVEPTWNESFQLYALTTQSTRAFGSRSPPPEPNSNIVDPEETDLVVSVLDGKKAVGEIEFPLRSSKRTQFEEVGGWGTLRCVVRAHSTLFHSSCIPHPPHIPHFCG
jgi:hypothetical protein